MEGALMPGSGEDDKDEEEEASGHRRVRAGDMTSGDVLRVCMGERHGGVTVRWLRRCGVTSAPGYEWEEACPALRIPAAHPDAMVLGACYVPCRREAGGTGGDEISLVASSAVGAGMECTLRVHEAVLPEGTGEVEEGLPAAGRGRGRARRATPTHGGTAAGDAARDTHGPAGGMRGAAAEPRLAMDLSPSVGHPVNHLVLARSPSGLDTLSCVTDGGHIMLVDIATAQTRRAWMAQSGVSYRVAADPTTPGVYVTCGFEPVVRIWDERESPWGRGGGRGGRARGAGGRVSPSRCSLALEGHRYRCYDAQWSQDGIRVVTAGGDGFVRVFDVRMADAPLAAAQRSFWWLERSSFFAGGRGVLAGGGDCRVRCWAASRRDGGLLHAGVLDEHLGAVTGLAVAGGSTVVSAGADGAVAVRTLSPGAVDYSGSGSTDESPIRSWKSGMEARAPTLALAGSGNGRSTSAGASHGAAPLSSSSSPSHQLPSPASLGEAVRKPPDSDRGSGSLVSVQGQGQGRSPMTMTMNGSPAGVRGAGSAASPRALKQAAAGSSPRSTGGLPSTLSWREARAGEQGAADAEQGWLRRLRLAGVTSVSAAGGGRHRMLLEDGRKSFRQPVGWQQGGRGFLHKLGGLPADWGQATPRGDWWGVREWDGGRMGGERGASVAGVTEVRTGAGQGGS